MSSLIAVVKLGSVGIADQAHGSLRGRHFGRLIRYWIGSVDQCGVRGYLDEPTLAAERLAGYPHDIKDHGEFSSHGNFSFAAAAQRNAQPPTLQAPASFLNDIWLIVQPVVVMLVSTAGPILVPWLAAKLAALLQSTDEAKRKEIEDRLRVALHTSAFNALKYAASRAGVQLPDVLSTASPAVKDAIDAFKLSNDQLAEIVISKAPDVKAIIAAGQLEAKK